jgi:hypothetical protein
VSAWRRGAGDRRPGRIPGRADRLVLLGALAATLGALLACFALLDTPGYVHGGRLPGSEVPGGPGAGGPAGAPRAVGDLTHYVAWTRLVTLEGVEHAYRGTYPETFALYGPVVMASYRVAGVAYRAAVDPAFEAGRAVESRWLRRALKLVAVSWHFAAGVAVCLVLVRAGRLTWSWAAGMGALYLADPMAVLDVGHWGQPDGALALFAVLAIGLGATGRWGPAGAALALAALAKPQAWVLFPLAGLAAWHGGGVRAVARAAGGGAVAGAVVLLPFLAAGRLGDLLALPGVVARAMPVVSGNAHNFWWLVVAAQGSSPVVIRDTAPLVGALTYREAALLLLAGFLAFVAWLVRSGRAGLAEGAALWTVGWFGLTTQAHENHAFVALPLLALALPWRPRLGYAFALLSLTGLLNLTLQDPLLLDALGLAGPAPETRQVLADLRTLNATGAVALLLGWSILAASRNPVRRDAQGEARGDARRAPLGEAWR